MTNLQKFAAQRLTKNQMNNVKGGRVCTAILKTTQEEVSVTVADGTAAEEVIRAGLKIESIYGDIATNIKCR